MVSKQPGFSTQQFDERFEVMGDTAEHAFKAWAEAHNVNYVAYGLNRPPFRSFYLLPEFIRMTPDFLCEGESKFFVECKGSAGTVVKIKLETMRVLREWNDHLPLWFFIYDSTNHRYSFIHYAQLNVLCQGAPIKKFRSDQKEYYHLRTNRFSWEPLRIKQENHHDHSPKEQES